MFDSLRSKKVTDPVLIVLKQNLHNYGKICSETDLVGIYNTIRNFTTDPYADKGAQKIIVDFDSPAIIIPLLIAHSYECNPDNRERMIGLLRKFRVSILSELIQFIREANREACVRSWFQNRYETSTMILLDCARYTAVEALAERAHDGNENQIATINFLKTLLTDTNSRIRNNVSSIIEFIHKG